MWNYDSTIVFTASHKKSWLQKYNMLLGAVIFNQMYTHHQNTQQYCLGITISLQCWKAEQCFPFLSNIIHGSEEPHKCLSFRCSPNVSYLQSATIYHLSLETLFTVQQLIICLSEETPFIKSHVHHAGYWG